VSPLRSLPPPTSKAWVRNKQSLATLARHSAYYSVSMVSLRLEGQLASVAELTQPKRPSVMMRNSRRFQVNYISIGSGFERGLPSPKWYGHDCSTQDRGTRRSVSVILLRAVCAARRLDLKVNPSYGYNLITTDVFGCGLYCV
jgi:hypothetical protein